VALNIVGGERAGLSRKGVLVAPDAWHFTGTVDVRLRSGRYADAPARPPEHPVLHIGAADVAVRVRPLGDDLVRLSLDGPLPLRIGDRAILRDPGSRRLWGVTVLDPAPAPLRRRGSGRRRAAALATHSGEPVAAAEVKRRGVVDADLLRRIGVPCTAEGHLVSEEAASLLRSRMADVVRRHDEDHPLEPGVPLQALTRALALPSVEVTTGLVEAPLRIADGRVTATAPGVSLPAALEHSLTLLALALTDTPFAAPHAHQLAELGLDRPSVAAAAKAGRLLDLGTGGVLLPGADRLAAEWLADLPQPFTTSEARQRLDTSRRVVLPLLAHLDRVRLTRRHEDDRRSVMQIDAS
jgi:selenocysteine-specific elongation factor